MVWTRILGLFGSGNARCRASDSGEGAPVDGGDLESYRPDQGTAFVGGAGPSTTLELAALWLGRTVDLFYAVHLPVLLVAWVRSRAAAASDPDACVAQTIRFAFLVALAESLSVIHSIALIVHSHCCPCGLDEPSDDGCWARLVNARASVVWFTAVCFCVWAAFAGPSACGSEANDLLWATLAFPIALAAASLLLLVLVLADACQQPTPPPSFADSTEF